MSAAEKPSEYMRLSDIMREKGFTRTDAERVMRRVPARYKLGAKYTYARRSDVERVIAESRLAS